MRTKAQHWAVAAGVVALALTGCSTGTATEPSDSTAPTAEEGAQLPTEIRQPTGEQGQFADLVPADLAEAGVFVAAGSGQVAPLQYVPEGGDSIIGIVADLTAEYAWRLGVDLRIEQASGSGTIPGVESGMYDAALAAGDFAERRGTLTFVDILRGGTVLLESTANPTGVTTPEDLCGHSLAVTISSIQQTEAGEASTACEERGEPAIDIQAYDTIHSAMLAVQSGQAELMWNDISPANVAMAETPGVFQAAGDLMWFAPYGVGVSVDRPELAEAIRTALQSMHDDGTYQEILEAWHSENLALDAIEINGSEF